MYQHSHSNPLSSSPVAIKVAFWIYFEVPLPHSRMRPNPHIEATVQPTLGTTDIVVASRLFMIPSQPSASWPSLLLWKQHSGSVAHVGHSGRVGADRLFSGCYLPPRHCSFKMTCDDASPISEAWVCVSRKSRFWKRSTACCERSAASSRLGYHPVSWAVVSHSQWTEGSPGWRRGTRAHP